MEGSRHAGTCSAHKDEVMKQYLFSMPVLKNSRGFSVNPPVLSDVLYSTKQPRSTGSAHPSAKSCRSLRRNHPDRSPHSIWPPLLKRHKGWATNATKDLLHRTGQQSDAFQRSLSEIGSSLQGHISFGQRLMWSRVRRKERNQLFKSTKDSKTGVKTGAIVEMAVLRFD